MQYEVNSPKEYFEILEDDWRKEKLLKLHEMLLSKAPELEEVIQYKMLCYQSNNELAFALNAQKHYVSFYVGNIKRIDPDGELLKGLNLGKGCIRFSKTSSISNSRMDEFIERAVELWRSGADSDC